MKLTSEALKKLIKEELEKINENFQYDESKLEFYIKSLVELGKKTRERLAALEKTVQFLAQTYEETTKDSIEKKMEKYGKTKPKSALQEGDKNDD